MTPAEPRQPEPSMTDWRELLQASLDRGQATPDHVEWLIDRTLPTQEGGTWR
jgi:hypothetical protein